MNRPHVHRRSALALALVLALLLPLAALAQSTVSGVYAVNGKPAQLTQVTAHKGEALDQPVTVLVLSAKDQGGDPKADFHALFNTFGDAVVVSISADGKIYNCGLAHAGFSTPGSVQVIGILKVEDFKIAGGEVFGHLTSGGEQAVLGDQKMQIDLTFRTKAP